MSAPALRLTLTVLLDEDEADPNRVRLLQEDLSRTLGGHRHLTSTWNESEPWEDRHEVTVPAPCSLDEAFDGEAEPQRRELRALERDVLCRLLSDVLYQVRLHRTLDALTFDPGPGGVRLEAWEVPLLENVWEALQPRSENNW